MLRFNDRFYFARITKGQISIHPMLRFNILWSVVIVVQQNFNTSYVTVQRFWYHFFIILGYISIHPMLRFNCHTFCPVDRINNNFNTSYVTVQPLGEPEKVSENSYFNTSYVTVQHFLKTNILSLGKNFNTSYVTVQHSLVLLDECHNDIFQYILCYGSTNKQLVFKGGKI